MWQRFILAMIVMASPSVAWAQVTAEKLLPSGSQIYFHWEGYSAHKKAYNQTAIGKTMNGDMGKFLKAAFQFIEKQGKKALKMELDPQKVDLYFKEINGAVSTIMQNGIVMGVELRSLQVPDAQAVIVFPKGAGKAGTPLSMLITLAEQNPVVPFKQVKLGERTFFHIQANPVNVVWWAEGTDAVLSIGTDTPQAIARNLKNPAGDVTQIGLHKEMMKFDEFPSWCRGYIDLPKIGLVASQLSPQVPKIVDDLGLKAFKGVTYHLGFDGPAERSVVFMHLDDAPRKGILNFASKKAFTLKDLPPMPREITGFSASVSNLSAIYTESLKIAELVVKLAAPEENIDIRGEIANFEQRAGVKIKEGFLDTLDGLGVQYADGNEGILGVGAVSLAKVKDGKKLEASLGKLFKFVETEFPGVLIVRKSKYRGANIYVLDMQGQGQGATAPSFTIYKGWLAFSNYPQPIEGFILRANGKLPTWKMTKELEKVMKPFPEKFTGIRVSDPRPSMRAVLSTLPILVGMMNTVTRELAPAELPDSQFDIRLIPNAYEATRFLFPNVTIYSDEGTRLRADTRSSLPFAP